MAAAAPPPVAWATNHLGLPIYAEADAAEFLERLQLNLAGRTVNTAGNVIQTDPRGEPINAAGNPIRQPAIGVCIQDMYITMNATVAGTCIAIPIASPAPGMVPAGSPFALNSVR
jgi:hypothetical protein